VCIPHTKEKPAFSAPEAILINCGPLLVFVDQGKKTRRKRK
jgi:hypothetical protein